MQKAGVISVERGSAEAATFLHERLRLSSGALAALSTGFLLVAASLGMGELGFSLSDELGRPGNQWHVAQIAIFAAAWALCRWTRPRAGALELLDAASMIGACACHAAIAYLSVAGSHPSLDIGGPPGPNPPSAATANLVALVARAILVPSSVARTLVIGALSAAPMVAGSALVEARHPGPAALSFLFGSVLWSLMAVALAALVSAVIYRLEKQARAARALGQYTIEHEIGAGGMGTVYRARHVLLQRPTALKVLPRERAGARALERFEREVRATSRLTHPNTISIYDYGRTADGVFYYAMELLDGVDLDRLVRVTGPAPAARVVHVLAQVCGALTEAHEIGLIHRDVKPANVFLCRQGGIPDVAKVLDFGLVREVTGASELTRDGADALIGTPLYLSPEALRGIGRIDARSDLYALGCTAHFLLTGRAPFEAESLVEVCAKHLHMPYDPAALSDRGPLPDGLEPLLIACLEKDPNRRPGGARELARALRAISERVPWTDDDANGWWAAHAARLGPPAAHAAAEAGAGARLTVDLAGRVQDT